MLFALLLALIAIASGALVTYLFDDDAPPTARLCMGACIGFAVLGLVGFILASFLGLTPSTLILTAIVTLAPLALLFNAERRAAVRADYHEAVRASRRAIFHPTWRTGLPVAFYALITLLLWFVFDRAMFEKPDGIYTGVMNNYGDLPFHLSIITGFADGQNFPPEDPTWAGARFTYPFMADFIAACFVRAGATLRQALMLENFILAISFVGILHRFTWKLTRDWVAGLIAPALVLLSGGLGFWHLFQDARWNEKGLFGILFDLPQIFTDDAAGYSWGNSLTTLLIPQRGILLGFPLALIVFTVWWTSTQDREEGKRRKAKGKRKETKARVTAPTPSSSLSPFAFFLLPSVRRMFVAGAIAGLLPLVHAHSFVVVMVMGVCVGLLLGLKEWRAWAGFFVAASLIALPQMFWATRGSSVQAGDFFGLHFGWDKKPDENILWFWFKNTGFFIPLIVAAFLWRKGKAEGREYLASRQLLLFYLPFTLCFIVPNLVKLAPWPWDNIKVIFYWFLASAPIVALLLARLLRESLPRQVAAVVLLLSLIFAGALDVWSVASRAGEFRIFDADGVAFAEVVKRETSPRATILHAPTFDTPVFLTGRRSVMGYTGHVSSHGIDYRGREQDLKRIYAGGLDAPALLAKYGIEYVVVGPHERRRVQDQGMDAQESFFSRHKLVGEKGEYRLYKITRP